MKDITEGALHGTWQFFFILGLVGFQIQPKPPKASMKPNMNHHRLQTHREIRRDSPVAERYRYYIRPRAYPDHIVPKDSRLRAFRQLQNMRKRLGIIHRNPGWLDTPQQPVPAVSGECTWSSSGPTNINGRITSIAIDPNDNQKIFATSVGGVWRSLDGGRRWQRVSDGFLATVFASIAVDPSNGNAVFAGAGDPNYAYALGTSGIGIWRSLSGGAAGSWNKVSPPELDGQVVFRIRIDPVPPHDIYAATSAGVFIGTVQGTIWQRLAGFDAKTTDVAVDFSTTPRRVYAGASESSTSFGNGIWKYDGSSWQRRDSGIDVAKAKTISLALASSNPTILYAKVQNRLDNSMLGIFKTTSAAEGTVAGGNAWTILQDATRLATDVQDGTYAGYNSVLEVDPTDASTVYGGGVTVWRTTDGGAHWEDVSSGSEANNPNDPQSPLAVHFDEHAVAFDPSNSKIVFVGSDGGIYQSTDTSSTQWHWNDISHGMISAEFYRINSGQETATLIAGGSQDNGTEISFGNRTWYNPGGCDGFDVAVDAEYSTFYAGCNQYLTIYPNPVLETPGGGTPLTVSSSHPATPPFVSDQSLPRAALTAGTSGNRQLILKTSNTVQWTSASQQLPRGQEISALAIAPSSAFQTYYAAIASDTRPLTFPTQHCAPPSVPPTIWHTINGGTTWLTTVNGLPANLWPNRLVVDYNRDDRAFVAFGGCAGGSVLMTINRGVDWAAILGSGDTALPSAAVMSVAIDPNDSSVIYAATTVGVFRGKVNDGPPPTASWTPFDDGLPDGLDTNDLWVDRLTGLLTVATDGHGIYQRDIRPAIQCQDTMLIVRDNVLDRGLTPSSSPTGVPDPEHPITDTIHPELFRPDNTSAGRLYWWNSTDIRLDVPSNDSLPNMMGSADHVEMETCPINSSICPTGAMMDSNPQPGQFANVYVQVSNKGIRPASNTRVIALWTDGTISPPPLPIDFWSVTFPPNSTNCGTLTTNTGWNAVDPANPCRLIPVVNPELPEVVQFHWNVPATAAQQRTMLAIIESADDVISPSVRSTNELHLEVLVPQNRQIALRNIHVIDVPRGNTHTKGIITMNIPLSKGRPIELGVSQAGMDHRGKVGVFLPSAQGVMLRGIKRVPAKLDIVERRSLAGYGIDPTVVYVLTGTEGIISSIAIPLTKKWRIGIQYQLEGAEPNKTYRFSVVTRQDKAILGGGTYLLRTRISKFH